MRLTLLMVGKARDSPAKFCPSLDRPANFCPSLGIFCPAIHPLILVTGLSRRFLSRSRVGTPDCSVSLRPGHLIDQGLIIKQP